jgi:mono/diheme cytochrome c family protein
MLIESPMIVRAILISPFMVLNLLAAGADDASGQPALEFSRDVLPILSDHCFSCHGPDEASRLDLREDALKSNDGVAAIAPGQPTLSELIRRIKATDDDTLMPPPDALKPLSAAQKEILERWIADGARYAGHWAFSPPKRVDPPTASKSAWSRNTIDRFVLQRLAAAGLAPSPEVTC